MTSRRLAVAEAAAAAAATVASNEYCQSAIDRQTDAGALDSSFHRMPNNWICHWHENDESGLLSNNVASNSHADTLTDFALSPFRAPKWYISNRKKFSIRTSLTTRSTIIDNNPCNLAQLRASQSSYLVQIGFCLSFVFFRWLFAVVATSSRLSSLSVSFDACYAHFYLKHSEQKVKLHNIKC